MLYADFTPFDILSGKCVKTDEGIFWFKEHNYDNVSTDGWPNDVSRLHRENNLPAAIWSSGSVEWYKNGKPHREDGPAIIYPSGKLEWWLNGMRHREDGPAIIDPWSKDNNYWLYDEMYTKKQFDQEIKRLQNVRRRNKPI